MSKTIILKKKAYVEPKPLTTEQLISELLIDAQNILNYNEDKFGGTCNQFIGPCSDSFCYASCNMAVCRSELRKGKTPKEHNAEIERLAKLDVNYYMLMEMVKKLRKQLTPETK